MSGKREREWRQKHGVRIGHTRREERKERAWDAKVGKGVKVGGATLGTLLTTYGFLSGNGIAVVAGTSLLFGTGVNIAWDTFTKQ